MIDAAPPPAETVVVSRRDGSEVVASLDTPLVLAKGPRREEALLRRAVFVTSSVTVTRPAAGGAESYRWTHQGYLQRQVCFSSMTGLFSCTEPQVEPLPEKATGEAPRAGEDAPLADAARTQLAASLRTRAPALFESDRRANVDPLLRAAGVGVVRAAPPRAGGPRARGAPGAGGGSGARR